jgi:hypothetical protein
MNLANRSRIYGLASTESTLPPVLKEADLVPCQMPITTA